MPGAIEGDSLQLFGGTRLRIARRRRNAARAVSETFIIVYFIIVKLSNHVISCVTELEDAATDTERIKSVPQPLVQESAHPYTDDAVQTGHVRIAGAEGLRVEFDRQVRG